MSSCTASTPRAAPARCAPTTGSVVSDEGQVDFDHFRDRYVIGTPDDAVEQVRELQEALGMTELTCWMQLPGITSAQAMRSAELFAREVIPAFAGVSS